MTKALARTARRPALKGIVTAIVAVTGVEDDVQDIIVPGAFEVTLKKRRPKVCYMHDWKDPIGRVLKIEELAPGDKRLPAHLPDGRVFPAEGGAVIATMQFHLGTMRGREAFEHCRQWHINGEAAFSIGYKATVADKGPDGVRRIYAMNLYEVSLVLHGAHNMALALEVKSADGDPTGGIEVKDSVEQTIEVPDASVMVALHLDDETAAKLAVPGGMAADSLHVTLALPGEVDQEAVVAAVKRAAGEHGPLSGGIGGVGVFPPSASSDNGVPIWRTVDVPGLVELRQSILAALAAAGFEHQSEHGFTPHMTIGYDLPSVAPIENVPVRFEWVGVTRGDENLVRVQLGQKHLHRVEGKAAMAVMEARLTNAYLSRRGGHAAVLEAKMLTASTAATVSVPTLGSAGKTKTRKRRAPNRPQEVTR